MRVKVVQCFACGSKVYRPGTYDLTPELAADLDELQRTGWVIVIEDAADPVQLSTPEDGQPLVLRQ